MGTKANELTTMGKKAVSNAKEGLNKVNSLINTVTKKVDEYENVHKYVHAILNKCKKYTDAIYHEKNTVMIVYIKNGEKITHKIVYWEK